MSDDSRRPTDGSSARSGARETPPSSAARDRDGSTADEEAARPTAREDGEPLLAVEDLRTYVRTDGETVRAVDGVNFAVDAGETVCLVGDSGSGKSITCESLTRIVSPPAEIVGGSVVFDGTPLLEADGATLRRIRGRRIAHVFQNPQGSLDPVYAVGDQLVEAMRIHGATEGARDRAVELLRRVGIPNAAARIDDYPHEFSGGMRQRIAVAIALAADPDLVIADEPTTNVDVTVQAQLLDLLEEVTDRGTALLLVTHDLRVVASVADRVLVMVGGTIVERGPVEAVFARPAHPYTQALFDSYRGLGGRADRPARGELPTDGCRFRPECPHAVDGCAGGDQPPFYPVDDDPSHRVSCVHYEPGGDPGPVLRNARDARESADGRTSTDRRTKNGERRAGTDERSGDDACGVGDERGKGGDRGEGDECSGGSDREEVDDD